MVQCRKQRHVLPGRGESERRVFAAPAASCQVLAAWDQPGLPAPLSSPIQLLQDVQLSHIFPDSKTFVDKPTNGSLNATLQAFAALGDNLTAGQIADFVSANFVRIWAWEFAARADYQRGEGLELNQVPLQGFNYTPAFLDNVDNELYRAWMSIVNIYWTLLVR
jgi:alpha,alpha-trehalase